MRAHILYLSPEGNTAVVPISQPRKLAQRGCGLPRDREPGSLLPKWVPWTFMLEELNTDMTPCQQKHSAAAAHSAR